MTESATPTPVRAPTRRDRQREATRQRVFDAAVDVFKRDGVAESRIEDITNLAKVSRGAFYFHFPTKEAVLAHLFELAEADFVAAVGDLPDSATIEDVFAATAAAIGGRWSAEPRLFMEVGIVALRNTAGTLQAPPTGIRVVLASRFEVAATRGQISDAVPAQMLADFYLANIFAVGIGWSTNPLMPLQQALLASGMLFLHGAGTGG